jgi:hypothetical protein
MRSILRRYTSSMFLASLLLTLLAASTAFAETPGRHPAYPRARTDLVRARILLQLPDERNVQPPLRMAVGEVDAAILEIDRAAVLDRKDIEVHPSVDVRLRGRDKFREIARLLHGAQRDIDHEEDSRGAREWRNRAMGHIDAAFRYLQKARLVEEADWRQYPR